jgi:hypothetical protein
MRDMSENAAKSLVLALTSVASFMVALDALVVTTALSTIRLDLGASIEALEWTVNGTPRPVSGGLLALRAPAGIGLPGERARMVRVITVLSVQISAPAGRDRHRNRVAGLPLKPPSPYTAALRRAPASYRSRESDFNPDTDRARIEIAISTLKWICPQEARMNKLLTALIGVGAVVLISTVTPLRPPGGA